MLRMFGRIRASLVLPIAALVAGCSFTDARPALPSFVIMPAQPRDEGLVPVSLSRQIGPELETRVLRWHTSADWEDTERSVRFAADRRENVVISIYRGEILRCAEQRRSHECWYLLVVVGSPVRLLDDDHDRAGV